jgi:hypothetical protein
MRTFAMHVHGPTMARNHALGENAPVVCCRPMEDLELAIIVREAKVAGESTFVHRPESPLPNTAGKAVAWVQNHPTAPVLVRMRDGEAFQPLTDELMKKLGRRGI